MTYLSIIIPTFNSEKTIKKCLESIRNQTFKNNEVIIVDSYSKDNTIKISKEFDDINMRIIFDNSKPFYARYIGFKKSYGDIILFLDSDQWFTRNNVLEEIVEKMKKYDSLILEEKSYNPKTFAEKLFDSDRKLLHLLFEEHKDPLIGALYPRAFKRDILEKTYSNIPINIMKEVWLWDDAILWYEYSKISNNIGLLKDAIYHKEISSIADIIKKYYIYGKNSKIFINKLKKLNNEKDKEYIRLINKKVSFRKGAWKYPKLAIMSYILMILKGIGYEIGRFF